MQTSSPPSRAQWAALAALHTLSAELCIAVLFKNIECAYVGVRRPNWRWLGLTTVHWYKAAREQGDTVHTLLEESPLRSEMANLKNLVDVSKM